MRTLKKIFITYAYACTSFLLSTHSSMLKPIPRSARFSFGQYGCVVGHFRRKLVHNKKSGRKDAVVVLNSGQQWIARQASRLETGLYIAKVF